MNASGNINVGHFLNSREEAFCVFKKDGSFGYFSDATPEVLGCSSDDLKTKTILDLVHEFDVAKTKDALKDVVSKQEVVFENRFLCDGEERWISWSLFLVDAEIYGIGHDVTSVHDDQETLQIAQNRLRLLHQATSNPTEMLSEKIDRVLNLGNLQLNMKLAVITRIDDKDIFEIVRMKSNGMEARVGTQFDKDQSLDGITLQAGNLIGIHNIGKSVYEEHPTRLKEKYESYLAVPLYIEGEIFGVLSFVSNEPREEMFEITDYDFLRLMGQWISSSLALLYANEQIAYDAAVVSSSEDAIIGQQKDGLITLWNVGAQKLFQFTEEEVLGKHFSIIVPDDAKEEVDTILNKILKGERLEHYSTLRKRKDGSLIDVSVTVSPIVNEEGNIVGASSVIRDITREKQIDRAKTEFVSLASHQLRTPLSAINWYSELLRDGAAGKLSKQQKEFVDEIFLGNQRMVKLVNELLNVSRIDFGNFSIEPSDVDIVEITHSVVKELTPKIVEKNLKVEEKYGSKEIIYFADPNIFRILVQNLISNSVKYTPEKGKVVVIVEEKPLEQQLYIEVTDNGYGIPEGEQDRIFSKLFRADNVKEMDTVGTGLGLYVLKSIVEESGGEVDFTSKLGEGTTFWIKLPLAGMKKKEGGKALSQVTP